MLRLLKQQDLKGLGGVLLEEVQESLPHCEKALKKFVNDIVYITRPIDKKKVLFYNDRSANLMVDEDFQKLWRTATVDAMDDAKIDEYLEKQGANFHFAHTPIFTETFKYFVVFFLSGIRSMQDHGPKKPLVPKRKKSAQKRRQFKKPRDNEHLADVLEVYEDNTITQEGAKIAST